MLDDKKEYILKKTYVRGMCDTCMKRTRLITLTKMKDEGKDSWHVQCETCGNKFFVNTEEL